MVYIVDIVTFIKFFSNIIKNHTKAFRDIGSGDISHNCYYKFCNNYICHEMSNKMSPNHFNSGV